METDIEEYKQLENKVCPTCGTCPTCGKGNNYWPYYQWPYYHYQGPNWQYIPMTTTGYGQANIGASQ